MYTSGNIAYLTDTAGQERQAAEPMPVETGVTAGLPSEPSDSREAHPRLLAMIVAARYHGIELDPQEYRLPADETELSAASLSSWAQNAGLWSRAVRLRWRHLMQFNNTGPVVLLFTDGTAGLLTGVNHEHNIVFLKDPRGTDAGPAVAIDEARLSQVWSGEAIMLRAQRGVSEANAPFSFRWLLGLVVKERRSLRDIGLASLTLSMLTISRPSW